MRRSTRKVSRSPTPSSPRSTSPATPSTASGTIRSRLGEEPIDFFIYGRALRLRFCLTRRRTSYDMVRVPTRLTLIDRVARARLRSASPTQHIAQQCRGSPPTDDVSPKTGIPWLRLIRCSICAVLVLDLGTAGWGWCRIEKRGLGGRNGLHSHLNYHLTCYLV